MSALAPPRFVLLALASLLLTGVGCGSTAATTSPEAAGPVAAARASATTPTKAPSKAVSGETFKTPSGGTLNLDTANLERRTLYVFAANFCNRCRRETPQFIELADEQRGKIDVVGVIMDDTQSAAAEYVKTHSVPYETIWDPEWRFAMRYKVGGTPTLVLVDTDGTKLASSSGLTDAMRDQLK